tara:strand:- start:449 stop:1258 length:810 start_codon:yes stop_codon:yes gene_type:complete
MASITFNGKPITDKLDLLAKTQLPWLATKTLQGLAQQVKKDLLIEMDKKFVNFSSFTQNSLVIKPSTTANLETQVFHKDKASQTNQPEDYLKPTIVGGDVYLTAFQRRLKRKGIIGGLGQPDYMMPIHNDKPGYGKVTSGTYMKALWGIRAMEDVRVQGSMNTKKTYKTQGAYVWVPENVEELSHHYAGKLRGLNNPKYKKGKPRPIPGVGIYKVQKSGLKKVFAGMDIPDYEIRYKFRPTGETSVSKNYERIFREQVKKYAPKSNLFS